MAVAITAQLTPNPASGNTTTDGTEQVLASSTSVTGGSFVFLIDTTNMVDGDAIELRVFSNANSAAYMLAYFASFAGAQTDVLKTSLVVPVESTGRYKVSLKRTAGTDRAYQWKVLQL